jgi:hypothetical protein
VLEPGTTRPPKPGHYGPVRRIEAAGLKFLLDFHYSDTWADPQKQFKPKAWEALDYPTLQDSVTAQRGGIFRL